MSQLTPEQRTDLAARDQEPPRPQCRPPTHIGAAVARYDAQAKTGRWDGPRYRMTYRALGHGPPLIVVPGIASTYRTYAILLTALAERFRTIVYDYPGEQQGDGARLAGIGHDHLVDDVYGLCDHLGIGRPFLLGVSFGSTVVLRALEREPRRCPRAAVQGAFAVREFKSAERWALRLGRLVPGKLARLPLRRAVLTYNSKTEFPAILEDRWRFYLEENGLTPIRALAHRVKLLTYLDLRPILARIPTELLLLQGNEDRIVPRRHFEMLKSALPRAEGVILPTVGHQPHLTHAELMARLVGDWLLASAPGGDEEVRRSQAGCDGAGSAPE